MSISDFYRFEQVNCATQQVYLLPPIKCARVAWVATRLV